MSFDYVGCCELPERTTIEESRLRDFLAGLGISFENSSTHFLYNEDDYLAEEKCSKRSWADFIEDGNAASASSNATFEGQDFRFTLGFFADRGARHALFEISNRNIDRLSGWLEKQNLDLLDFFVGLYRCIGATSMAVGISDYQSLMRYLNGQFTTDEIAEEVCVSIHGPSDSEAVFLSHPKAKQFVVDDVAVLARGVPGLERRFSIAFPSA